MSKSLRRVQEAAKSAGLEIRVQRMPETTRTAAQAASACGCAVEQIVKSMVFQGGTSGELLLVLLSGAHQLDLKNSPLVFGEALQRAEAKQIRAQTGFAIGGVAPIGHKSPIRVWMDQQLLEHDRVWAAAGTPNAVFEVAPKALLRATGATLFQV